MRTLKAVLSPFLEVELGGKKKEIDPNRLIQELEEVKRYNNRRFFICVMAIYLLLLIFVTNAVMQFSSHGETGKAMGALGCAIAALLQLLIRFYRENIRIRLLLALLPEMKEKEFLDVLLILAKKI